jgi:bifunctional non-homologous end joining protein LigD
MPDFFSPMLATLVEAPFDSDDWLFEIKWDGFRALAFVKNGQVELKSRNNLSFNNKFPQIVKNLKNIKDSVILDGEIVVVDSKGKSHFQLIQNYQKVNGTLCYYVFDLLYKNGMDLRELPLIERKEMLKKYLEVVSQPLILYSNHIFKEGKQFFLAAKKENLEGIIGKKINSIYQSSRSRNWVKIKTSLRQEVLICGFTAPRGSRKKIGALIVGLYDQNKQLKYSGHVGGGFTNAMLDQIYKKLIPLVQRACPFQVTPKVNMPVTWVNPKLIGEVEFSEWTKENIMRHPIFQGLRNDKESQKITKEIPEEVPVKEFKTNLSTKIKGLELTNLDKIYWPEEKYTKGDLISYYESIAPFILPYLKNRPIMLHRFPDGIEGSDFYQKDIKFAPPSWIQTCRIKHEYKVDNYLMINDLQSLLFAVNLGSIDLHPFMCKKLNLEKPDFSVIDLDPHDISFDKVIEAALSIHEFLDEMEAKHFIKTSGGKGLHILIPLHAKYDFEQSRLLAEMICYVVHKKLPQTTSMERSPEKRPKKVYLDCLQNRTGQTIVAPYSVRPRLHATVSTPLEWEEVNVKLDVSKFTIKTIPIRLKKIGDILKPLLGPGIDIRKILKSMPKR